MPHSTTKHKWDAAADVIVVGSGLAGLAAAIEAAQSGCSVIVLEKMKGFGGNSTISDGSMAAAGSDMQARAGIDDSPARMAADMMKAGLGLNQPDLVRVVAERSAETFAWTRDYLGVRFQERVEQFGGHSVPRAHTTRNRSGADIIRQQLARAAEVGVTIQTRAYLQTILKHDDGRVCGLKVRQNYTYPDLASGESIHIRSRKAVVLAAGGFGNDIAFRRAQDPRLDKTIGSTNKYSATGGALREAMRTGALPVHLSWIQLGPWACPDEKGYGVGPDFSSYIAFPYGITVDPSTGRRFVNEMADRKVRADAILATGHPCLCVADHEALAVSGHEISRALKKGVVKEFKRLEDLSAAYGMPANAFEETVAQFNGFIADGFDPDFGKPILQDAAPLEHPPYYSMRLWPKVHYTMGGVLINTRAEVLDLQQKPIQGFYAAGEVAGGVHGACRLGSCAITDCLTFGRIAGQEAVKIENW